MKLIKTYLLILLIFLSLSLPESYSQTSQEPQVKVALFFDDGWKNHYDEAFPFLMKFGFKATFAIVSDYIGHDRGTFWARMNLTELKMLQESGMEIASHTKTHPHMLNLTHEKLIDEIINSKKALTQLGFKVKTFVYPHGEWNQTILEYVKEAGYACARTIKPEAYTIENPDADARYYIGSWTITNQSLKEFQEIFQNTEKGQVVVLTYHFISDETPKETSTSPQNFYEQMEYLKKNKYEVVLLSELFKTDEKQPWSPPQLMGIAVGALVAACTLVAFSRRKRKASRFKRVAPYA
ncbi:MAG: polysaccharide deacetylase family protein [Nitrososphaerota archaeon]|nr:polysaccharide deacetylase family protein [Candidatus Bathyarchaeota archaeon]MDW8023571.1 polysaccharide deacetylase family protein [Nitrososphaerota archaeon]